MSDPSFWRRLGQYLELLYAEDVIPVAIHLRRSRYNRGPLVSPRLDEDIDELRARLADLERRLLEP